MASRCTPTTTTITVNIPVLPNAFFDNRARGNAKPDYYRGNVKCFLYKFKLRGLTRDFHSDCGRAIKS